MLRLNGDDLKIIAIFICDHTKVDLDKRWEDHRRVGRSFLMIDQPNDRSLVVAGRRAVVILLTGE